MKRAFQLLLITTFIFGILSSSTNAQVNVDTEKKWSRVNVDKNFVPEPPSDYNYIPGPPVFQKYDFGETDVLVMPNYRIMPATNTTQSELSIDIHPTNSSIMFAGSNATNWPYSTIYGTGVYWTTDAGLTWGGNNNPTSLFGSTNSGDPAAVIGSNGNFYMGYIRNGNGQGVATSTNNGATWSSSIAGSDVAYPNLLDKNHLMVDKKVGSPFENRVYDTWTHFVSGNASNNQVVINYSTNSGTSWSTFVDLSSSLSPGSHAQGTNVQTGPNGEVYVTFAIYDAWPGGEDAIGFAKSTDGGATWTKTRIYSAVNFGIRGNIKPTSIRVSSFPSMAVDRSGGASNGYIYIVWPQIGVAPAGTDPDIVLIRSTNNGATWSAPVRVNDDPMNNGRDQYYPWCTVDQNTGQLNIVFYDSRNTTNDSTGVFMATSDDGGLTFDNFQVSDQNFRPKPISGLAGGYQGDYIGIAAANNKAYPFWMDDRTGNYQAWITEVTFGPSIDHTPLTDTENLAGPYVVNAVISSVNPLVAGSIKLYWGRGVAALTDSVVMTNTGGNNYTANIPGNGANAVYNYYLAAEDNQGFRSTLPGGAPTNYFTFNAATDVIAPTITHTAIGNTAQLTWPVDVSADVTDNIGVGSVVCEFKLNGGGVVTFPMPLLSGNTYKGTFTGSVAINDVVEYRIKATDNSSQSNVGYSPASGYNSFTIIDVLGLVLVVDDDLTLQNRISPDKGGDIIDASVPLGISASLFNSTLTAAGYLVEEVTWSALNTANLNNYDLVILCAGDNSTTMFNDAAKRTAITNWTIAGGKTIVEGGEVGYIYRKSGTTTDLDPLFRQNVLNDSSWVSDRSNNNLVLVSPSHPIFTTPNTITGPITVTNGSSSYGARDEVTLLNKPGVIRIANWSSTTVQANGSIIVHNPNNDSVVCRNIFFTFAVSQIADQNVAAALIENAVGYLFRDIIPVELTAFTANVSGNSVNLIWNTATELNNSGFEIQRKSANSQFEQVGYVAGFGTTTEPRAYSFTDSKINVGNYTYRLKQVDYDGSYEYSNEINVDVNGPEQYSLDQNYPNPFNPSTLIKYSIAKDGFVNVSIFNLLGEKVATLVNGNAKAGSYEINFNASQLSSGVYFYSIEAGDFKAVRKMMLMK
ncbi:MAG TPA: T9SS type A sorting domain-containing protein [Ignavibacteriaceae bacterium]|nr:T9SS type A sorting domain-containing protein [Ignavibacteriaceae bacterium]